MTPQLNPAAYVDCHLLELVEIGACRKVSEIELDCVFSPIGGKKSEEEGASRWHVIATFAIQKQPAGPQFETQRALVYEHVSRPARHIIPSRKDFLDIALTKHYQIGASLVQRERRIDQPRRERFVQIDGLGRDF